MDPLEQLFRRYKQALIRAWVMDANDEHGHGDKIRKITAEAHAKADTLEREFWQMLEKERKERGQT